MSSHLKPAVPALAIVTGVLMLATIGGVELKSAGPLSCGTLHRTGHELCLKSCSPSLTGDSLCQWRCSEQLRSNASMCV